MNAVTSPTLFDAQLMRETLRSERLRATMLASVVAVMGLTLFLLSRLDASEFLTALRQTQTEYTMLGLAGGLVLYELVLRHILGRLLHRNRRAPLPLRYVNAGLETTIPTLAIILFAQRFEPVYALVSVAPFAYFLFIVLATLRLEFWLCVFTGGIAAAEYVGLAWYYLAQGSVAQLHPMLRAHRGLSAPCRRWRSGTPWCSCLDNTSRQRSWTNCCTTQRRRARPTNTCA